MTAPGEGAHGTPPPATRAAVAVLLSRFPKVTETFILREIDEMERQGQPVVLVPLQRESPPVVHPQALPWLDRALFSPFLSVPILAANLRVLRRAPWRYLTTLGHAVAGAVPDSNLLGGALAFWPKAVWIGEELQARGVRHAHAHFATHPALVAWIGSQLHGIGFSFTAHAHDIFVHQAFLAEKVRAARFVRAISAFNRDWLVARAPEAAARTVVVHCGIEPTSHHSARPAPGPARLLTVAALEPYKGHSVLLRALAQLAAEGVELELDLVGDGPLRAALERECMALGLGGRVHFLGARPQEEVARRMAEAALFVLPSVVAADGQMEGIPIVLMEALASEVPVVATRLSGIPELVEDGVSGLLVTPGDAGALAEAIRRQLADSRAGRNMARRGREKVVREFALETTTATLCAELDRVNPAPAWFASEALGLGRGAVGLLRLHDRKDSFVAELVAGGRRLVYKAQRSRPGQSAVPEVRARREHALLERLHAAMTGRYRVPRPLRLDLAQGAVLMEACAGRSLEEWLRERRWSLGGARFGALENAVHRAGRWLQRFHRSSGLVHGDYWPGNVFVSGEVVEVVDFEGAREGDPRSDVEYFLRHLGGYLRFPLLGRRRARLEAAFREGYDGHPPQPPRWVASGRHLLPAGDLRLRRWFARHLFVPHGLAERLLPLALTPAAEPPAGAGRGLEEAGPLRFVHVADYPGSARARSLAFVFAPGASAPMAVVKRRASAAPGPGLEREHDALDALARWLPPALAAAIPRTLALTREGGEERLVIEALAGRSAYVELQQAPWPEAVVERHFALAAGWLAAFHVATRSRKEEMVGPVRLPLAAGHGDFWARNLLVGPGDAVRVVDFEHFRELATPLDDLFHFVVSYGLAFPWRRWQRIAPEEAFVRTLAMDTVVGRSARMYFKTYSERTGLELGPLEILFRLELERWAGGGSPRGEDGVLWRKLIPSIERRDLFACSG